MALFDIRILLNTSFDLFVSGGLCIISSITASSPAGLSYQYNTCRLDVIFSSIFRFCITKPPKKLYFNLLYTKHI